MISSAIHKTDKQSTTQGRLTELYIDSVQRSDHADAGNNQCRNGDTVCKLHAGAETGC